MLWFSSITTPLQFWSQFKYGLIVHPLAAFILVVSYLLFKKKNNCFIVWATLYWSCMVCKFYKLQGSLSRGP